MVIVLVNTITLAVLVIFIYMLWAKNGTIIEPGIIFAINLIFLYPVRAIVLLIFSDDALPAEPGAEEILNIQSASWVALIGCLGFALGYALVIKGTKRLAILSESNRTRANEVVTVAVLFCLTLIGIGYKIATADYMSYLISEEQTPGLSQIGSLLTSLQWPAYIGACVLWFKGNRSNTFLALFVCVLLVVIPFQFVQGSKTFLSLLLVSAVIAYYWVHQKLPKIGVLVGIYLVATFVFPFVQNFRETVNNDFGKIPSISKLKIPKISVPDDKSEADADGDGFSDSLLKVSARYAGIDELYGIMQTVPDMMDYRYGFEYTAFIINLVPRLVWPDKPIYSRGAVYGAVLGTTTSVTPFPVAEAYWDLGEYGVVPMMILWGGCLAGVVRLYNFYYIRNNFSTLIALYFLSQIYWISGGETSMPMVLAGVPQQVLMLYIIALAIRETERWIANRR